MGGKSNSSAVNWLNKGLAARTWISPIVVSHSEGIYWSAGQSRKERGDKLRARANRARREGIYSERGPIAQGERGYTWISPMRSASSVYPTTAPRASRSRCFMPCPI
eukprot:1183114-Prorocentrum_minimum.AAC.1